MKGNDGTGNIPERDLWETSQWLFDKLNKQYNFTFDCCATSKNTKCKRYSSNFESTILYPVDVNIMKEVCWMNPPFSKVLKMFKTFFSIVTKGVAIYRCDNMETKVWQKVILPNCSWVFIPKGRISYTPFETGNMRNGMRTRFPSALIGVGVQPPRNIEGIILVPKPPK